MQVFVINLARSEDRLTFMKGQLGDRFERIDAVAGAAVPERLAPQFASPDAITSGEIGCYASHLLAAEQIVARGLPFALIMEDDVEVAIDFFEVAEHAIAQCPPSWDEISLCGARIGNGLHKAVSTMGSRRLVRFLRAPKGLGAYLLSYNGALRLLTPRRRFRPVDVDMHYSCGMDWESYGVVPPPSRQAEELHASTIGKRAHRAHWAAAPHEYFIGGVAQLRKFGVWQVFMAMMARRSGLPG